MPTRRKAGTTMRMGSAMVEKAKAFWHDQIPAWLPIFLAILSGAFYVGQQQQSVMDRLGNLEKQVMAIQDYLRTTHAPPQSFLTAPATSPRVGL